MSSFKYAFILQIIVSRFNSVRNKQIKITQTHTHTHTHKLTHTLQKYFTTSQTPLPQKKNRIITIIIKIHDHNDNSNKILISYAS